MNKRTWAKIASMGLGTALSACITTGYANVYQLDVKDNQQVKQSLKETPDEVLNNPSAVDNGYNADPYEKFNRGVFEFNKVFLGLFVEPVAYIYTNGVWSPVQRGVSNVFNNISTVTTLPNDLLQGKVKYFFNDFWRLVINSTIGVGGIFDVAKHMGLKPHQTDFGMTLATWGAKRSKFIMLPILGPSTFRDGYAIPFNTGMSIYPYWNSNAITFGLYGAKEVDQQGRLLPAYQMMRQAVDPYAFTRNAYLQARNAQIARNNVPLKDYQPDVTDSGVGGNVYQADSETDDFIVADGSSTVTNPKAQSTDASTIAGPSKVKGTKTSHSSHIDKDHATAAAKVKTGKA